MKTAEEILNPYVEKLFRHTQVVEKDNALLAMEEYANQFENYKIGIDPFKSSMDDEFNKLRKLLLSIDSKHFTWNDARVGVLDQLHELQSKVENFPISDVRFYFSDTRDKIDVPKSPLDINEFISFADTLSQEDKLKAISILAFGTNFVK
jgi:hypothetical protein